jgi:hypothetical protein
MLLLHLALTIKASHLSSLLELGEHIVVKGFAR